MKILGKSGQRISTFQKERRKKGKKKWVEKSDMFYKQVKIGGTQRSFGLKKVF